jgi:hypothetical protein
LFSKSITRGNNVHKLYHIHRRQEEIKQNTNKHKANPTSISSIPTVTLEDGPVSLTLTTTTTVNTESATPIASDISVTDTATDISATGTDADTATPIATDIGAIDTETATATATATDIGAPIPTDTSAPEIPLPSTPPTITTPIDTLTAVAPIQTQNPLSSPSSIFPSTTSITSTTSPFQPIPSSGSSNNTKSNKLHVLMFSILAVSIFIMILTVLVLIYKKRKGKRNTLHNINAADITDKDKENGSKSNSLTSSINSISSSLKRKKGKIVPLEINIGGSPPAPTVLNNKDDEEKPQMPTLKRTPTTVSAFQELVDLTDDEHFKLRQSTSSGIYTIASRLSSTPTYVNYDAEEGTSSNAVNAIPLHQERIDTIIPYSSADSDNPIRTFTFPSDTSNNDNQ